MERLTPTTIERQRRHYADVMGRVACLGAMRSLGERNDELSSYGSEYDQVILGFGELISDGKYETFLDKVQEAQRRYTEHIHSTHHGLLRRTLLLRGESQLDQSLDFRRLEQAVTMTQSGNGWDEVGDAMLQTTLHTITPFYVSNLKRNIDASMIECSHVGSYLGLDDRLNYVARNAEFYADYYYEEENLKKW
jgi:hypothetical protein